jgi:hypothetical protein
MSEPDYSRVTYDLTLSVARVLARLNPEMTFIYVSGAGTDSSESGRAMSSPITPGMRCVDRPSYS